MKTPKKTPESKSSISQEKKSTLKPLSGKDSKNWKNKILEEDEDYDFPLEDDFEEFEDLEDDEDYDKDDYDRY